MLYVVTFWFNSFLLLANILVTIKSLLKYVVTLLLLLKEILIRSSINSDVISFDKKPEMKANEITDKLIEAIKSNKYDFLRTNFPNGDMVGHTGNYEATIKGLEAVDYNIGRIVDAVKDTDSILIVTADHGNSEEMINEKGEAKTSHTTNPVPFIIYNKDVKFKEGDFGLANIAATVCDLFGIEKNACWKESMIKK